MAGMSHGQPARWTTRIAFVRGPMTARDGVRGDVLARLVDVGEDRVRAGQHDAAGRGEEAPGRDDDLVTGPDPQDPQSEVEGERAVGQCDRVRDPVVGGELVLEASALVAGPVVDLAGSQDRVAASTWASS